MAETEKINDLQDEDPTVAAYRKFISEIDQMENGGQEDGKDENKQQSTDNLKSEKVNNEKSPLLLSTVQEEDELDGLDGPDGRMSTPPPPLGAGLHGPGGRLSTAPPPGVNGRTSPSSDKTSVTVTGITVTDRTSPGDGRTSPLLGRTSPLSNGEISHGSIGGRTSPSLNSGGRNSPFLSGRSSPRLHKGRVSPHLGVVEDQNSWSNDNGSNRRKGSDGSNGRKGSVHSIQVKPAPVVANNIDTNSGKNGTVGFNDTNNTAETQAKPRKKRASQIFVRAFGERASQENFALYGLLTPALCIVPKVDGVSSQI